MSYLAKTSIMSWWILIAMALLLWYRDDNFDRVISIFSITLALFSLIEYGVYSGADLKQSMKSFYLLLWLQCLVLAITGYLYINNLYENDQGKFQDVIYLISRWVLIMVTIIFLLVLAYTILSDSETTLSLNQDGMIEWNFIGMISWIFYLIFLLTPLVLILLFQLSNFLDLNLLILLIYLVIIIIRQIYYFYQGNYTINWPYISTTFVFLTWTLAVLPSIQTVNK